VRWGGEEFLVILPNVDALRVIEVVAERIRKRVRSAPVSVKTDVAGVPDVASVAVTVSIGALYAAPPADARGALAAVDRALYRAKSLGRDRVVGDVLAD
jgi:diguanylate cyclase (GGDEF)-like protein